MPLEPALVAYLDPLISESASANPPSLVEGEMPELPDNCVAVAHAAGEPPEEESRVMGASLANDGVVEAPHVQVMVRNTARATARSKAQAIYALLDGLGPTTLSGTLYHRVESLDGEPHSIGQDQNGRWRFVMNLRCRKARG